MGRIQVLKEAYGTVFDLLNDRRSHPDSEQRPVSIRMNEASRENRGLIVVLLVMTAATGIVDAVSYLGLGHVFTADMSGHVVLMGFRLGGASGMSLSIMNFGIGVPRFLIGVITVSFAHSSPSLPDHFHQRALFSPAVELSIEDLLPWAEIELPFRDGDHDFPAHHLPFQMGVGVVLARPVMTIL